MHAITLRYNYLFRSTKGLILVAIAMIALTTAFFGMISGPMVEFGIKDAVIRATEMSIVEAEREGRIIMLYHSIAMAVVAIEVYFITNMSVIIGFPTPDSKTTISGQSISLKMFRRARNCW